MSNSKKCFATVPSLKRIEPSTLADLLRPFPNHLKKHNITIPEIVTEDSLNYQAIRDALMGENVPEPLDDILYLSSRLGNARYWGIVEKQATEDGRQLPPANPDYGYIDAVIRAEIEKWPRYKGFLEKANARARVHGKSSYVYYPPIKDMRPLYRVPNSDGIEEVREKIADHFFEIGLVSSREQSRNTQVIKYDHEKEIWFLIRYPGKKSRLSGTDAKGEWKNYCFNPEQYDAIVYNKVYGDLRMNTIAMGDHAKYRIVFTNLLFGRGNVFQPKSKVVTLDPFKEDHAADMFGCKDVPGMDWIAPVRLRYELWGLPVKVYDFSHKDGSSLLLGNELGSRIVPKHTMAVTQVELAYKLKGREKVCKVTLHVGNRIRYDRDGDSIVLEEWLRKRKVLATYVMMEKNGPKHSSEIDGTAVGE
jgi:hypothetical protein